MQLLSGKAAGRGDENGIVAGNRAEDALGFTQ